MQLRISTQPAQSWPWRKIEWQLRMQSGEPCAQGLQRH